MPFRFEASTFVSSAPAESAAGDFTPDTRAEIARLRAAHPEILHWGDVALAAAWGDYSEDCWMNSWEAVPQASARHENFLNYLCWRQTRGEYPRGAGDEIADEACEWNTAAH